MQNIMQNKSVLGGLIAAAAVYAFYRISRMSSEEKRSLKEKGKKFINEKLGLGDNFSTKNVEPASAEPVIGS